MGFFQIEIEFSVVIIFTAGQPPRHSTTEQLVMSHKILQQVKYEDYFCTVMNICEETNRGEDSTELSIRRKQAIRVQRHMLTQKNITCDGLTVIDLELIQTILASGQTFVNSVIDENAKAHKEFIEKYGVWGLNFE